MLSTLFSINVFATNDIKVMLNGEYIKFDVQPQMINDRTMVPLRAIFEALGANVTWNGNTQTVIATTAATEVVATVGNTTMYVNGEAKTMDIAPVVIDGRTLIPARFVAEAFNCNVDWDGNTNTVTIKSGKIICTAVDGNNDIDELFDNDVDTYWTSDVDNEESWVIFKTNIPVSPLNYSIVIKADDDGWWNPKSWVLYGCNSNIAPNKNSKEWEIIDTVTNDKKLQSDESKTKAYKYFITNETPKYSYFKLEITESVNKHGLLSIPEFALSDTNDDYEYSIGENSSSENSSSTKPFVDKGIVIDGSGTEIIFDGYTYEMNVGDSFILKNSKVPSGTYYAYTWFVTEGDNSCVELDTTYEGTCKVTALKPGKIKITAYFDQTTVNIGYNAVHDSDERTAIIRILDNTGETNSNSSASGKENNSYNYSGYTGTKCTTCKGTGQKTCYTCNGKGTVTNKVTVPNYSGSTSGGKTSYETKTCPNVLCHGGTVDCMSCGGDGIR